MAGEPIAHFQNDRGEPTIRVGVKEFMCVGATPPFDHPHEYLDMGDDAEKICPYCSTLYLYDRSLSARESEPPGHLFVPETS